ncbi:uncharacterized protein LOC106155779 [Lingula anatina]|uniref:Uncharacterized protein LOC106155779 n=1 Tax=Lingula anatina TaxID=7574 RepID=A0A1S3HL89_LINAN|nr:uncharacterized protein LOC106155779 [Lingula anatina]|eukprot:XP_013386226.1 uncharacterized protein LOC106155779 [Lingula anatina]
MDNMSSIQRLKQNNIPPTVCVPCQKLARETKADISLLKTYTDRNVCKVRTDLTKPLVLNLEGSICTSNASEITELMKSVVVAEFGRDFHHKQNDMEEKITTIQERLDALGHINSSRPLNIPLVTPLPRTTTTKRPAPVAHVIGTCSKTSPGTRGSDCELHWEDDPSSSQSHINKGGVTLEDGYLKVPRPGYYYVYSQLCFNVQTNRQGHATFEHFLQRNCAIPLSDNRHILFQNWKHINLQTSHEHCSYLGGVVEMVRGCGVVVTVTGGQFLTPNKHMNYFGLYFIEGKEQM